MVLFVRLNLVNDTCMLMPSRSCRAYAFLACLQGGVPDELLDSQVDPASFEISGHIIMKRRQDYDGLTQDAIWKLLSYASLSEEAFIKFSHFALDF